MNSIIYLSDKEAQPMAQALVHAGFRVHDAVSVLGALLLARLEDVGAVVIDPSFSDPDMRELRRRIITVELKEEARPEEVVWELSGLLSSRVPVTMQ